MKVKSLIAAFIVPLLLCVSVFAQSLIPGVVIKNANLRAGPGTNYAIAGTVKAGQAISIAEKNAAGTWYHLEGGKWIASFLVRVTDPVTTTVTAPIPGASATQSSHPSKVAPVATSTPTATSTPLPLPTATPQPQPTANPVPTKQAANCDPSYPTVCIPPYPPDLNCKDVPYKRFKVIGADPHGFDRDHDGIGCES